MTPESHTRSLPEQAAYSDSSLHLPLGTPCFLVSRMSETGVSTPLAVSMIDKSNCHHSFFVAPLMHLPWGQHGPGVEDIENELGEAKY